MPANIVPFNAARIQCPGVLQEYDDFGDTLTFDNVNSYSEIKTKRVKNIMFLPMNRKSSSKSYTLYEVLC